MQTAQKVDQAVIKEVNKDNIEVEYVDGNENIDATSTATATTIEVETVTETIEDDEELTSENLF